jgi:starch phosphorylase
LEPLAGDPDFQAQFRQVKRTNQDWLGQVVRWRTGIRLLPGALFDVQAKRIHEYKRQLLCLLYAIVRYNRLRRGELANPVPRNLIFAGKAAPGYDLAKRIIKLINDVAARINGDPAVATSLRLAFVPNYDLSTAAILVPAADLSEQISTAGTEASGTGNMKMALNGALTIGTLDGANIELCRAVGPENFFPFGLGVQEVQQRRCRNPRPQTDLDALPELAEALEQIGAGYFSAGDPSRHRPVVDRLLYEDPYLVLADFGDYQRVQGAVDDLYLNPAEWTRRAILNLARMGSFSSDRTVRDYAREVWGLTQIPAAGG